MTYAGAAIVHPRIFTGAQAEPHSLNLYFDSAIAAGRVHGVVMQGRWITVGTPDAIAPAESAAAHARAVVNGQRRPASVPSRAAPPSCCRSWRRSFRGGRF